MRFNRMILWLLLVLLMLPTAGLADSMHVEKPCDTLALDVTVGYDGMMTYGRMMPMQIRIENSGDDLQGVLAINIYANRTQYNRYEQELTLAAGAVKEIILPVRVGSKQETYTVEVWQGEDKLCAVNAAADRLINPSAQLIGVLSPQPQQLAYMNVDVESDVLFRGEYLQTVPLTEESFPRQLELLQAFGVIVVDDFDVSLLSAQQQETLQRWLASGRVLIIGGGAQAGTVWPYFSEDTGLLPGEITRHADVTPALMDWLGVTGEPAGEELTLTAADGGTVLIADGETPLIWRSSVGEDLVYTTAFALSDRALMNWETQRSFWQRLLIKDCYTLYRHGFETSESTENYTHFATRIPLENDVSLLPVMLLVMALLLLCGAVAYLLLKRLDRRQLLWAVLPVLAVAATAIVSVIALYSPAIQPTALTISVLQQDETGIKTLRTSVVAATNERGEHVVSAEEGVLRPASYDYWYSEYDDGNKRSEPTELNYRYVSGQYSGVGVPFASPWEMKSFRVDALPVPEGQVACAVWMEDDGLHGFLHNTTGLTLEPGIFLCKFGFCSVPELKPGQRHELVLTKAEFPKTGNRVFKDGFMYESMASAPLETYAMVGEYFFKTSEHPDAFIAYNSIEQTRANLVNSVVESAYYDRNGYTHYTPRFHYVTFTEGLFPGTLRMDDEIITRTADCAMVSVLVPFQNVNNEGRISRIPGMDKPVRCQLDSQGRPYNRPEAQNMTGDYARLIDNPVYMFEVEGLENAVIERMVFYMEYMPSMAQALLYDGNEWVECTMGASVADPQRFVIDEGRIFIQFKPLPGANDYYEVWTPKLLLEGRME